MFCEARKAKVWTRYSTKWNQKYHRDQAIRDFDVFWYPFLWDIKFIIGNETLNFGKIEIRVPESTIKSHIEN